LSRVALEDESVERVEGQEILVVGTVRTDLRKHSALGRMRIDVAKMIEVRRVAEIAESGEAVRFDGVVRAGGEHAVSQSGKSRGSGECQYATP
jgi:hypothetical protein